MQHNPNFLGIINSERIHIGDYCLLPGIFPDERDLILPPKSKMTYSQIIEIMQNVAAELELLNTDANFQQYQELYPMPSELCLAEIINDLYQIEGNFTANHSK